MSNTTVTDSHIAFRVTALNPCAVICSRAALLPYASWSIRPAAGDGGNAAMLSLDIGLDDMPLDFLVSAGSVSLRAPLLGPLAQILAVEMQPRQLLYALKRTGMFLMPEDRDAPFADVVPKEESVERLMCAEVASLAGSHLIASSKWTQYVEVRITVYLLCRLAGAWEGHSH